MYGKKCTDCRFYQEVVYKSSLPNYCDTITGYCHKNPPVVAGEDALTQYPIVRELSESFSTYDLNNVRKVDFIFDACGEFKIVGEWKESKE